MKLFLQNNDIEMYSTQSESKYVLAEGFVKTLKKEIYKYMILVSENVHIDKLDDIVSKYNNTYHSTIEMKHV